MKSKTIVLVVSVVVLLFAAQLVSIIIMQRKSAAERMMDFSAKVNVAVNNAIASIDKSGMADYYESEGNDKLVEEIRKMTNVVQSISTDIDPNSEEYDDYLKNFLTEVSSDNYNFALYDSVIGESLRSYGIDFDYVMAFYDVTSRNMIFMSDTTFNQNEVLEDGLGNSYLVVNSNGTIGMIRLLLYFPSVRSHFYSISMSTWLNVILIVAIMVLAIGVIVVILRREKEAADQKTAFLNNMTHELKTPISTIKLVCEAMQDESFKMDRESASGMVGIIAEENERMYSLVDEMLKSVRISRGYDMKKKEEVDVHEALNLALESLSVLSKNRNAVIEKNLAATSTIVMSQENNLIGAFSNIIDNALKYSEGVPEISIATENIGNNIIVRISDKGIGISQSDQRRVFDEFFRADTGNRHDIKGYGIGLSYVKSVVKHSNGKIEVESELGKGTTFTITLPVRNA